MKKSAIQLIHDENIYKILPLVKKAGFNYVALGFGSSKSFSRDDWEQEILRLDKALKDNGLTCIQTHAPYYDLTISAEKKDPVMEKAIERCITATRMLGAKICAIHPRSVIENVYYVDNERSFEENIKDFSSYLKVCEKEDVYLGIENLPKFLTGAERFYSCNVEDHINLIDSLKSKYAVAVWDTGHSNLMRNEYRQQDGIRKLGKRIMGTHVHNNYIYIDDHNPPSLGTINWKEVMGAFKEIGYKGFLTLEVHYNCDLALLSFLKHCYECLSDLNDMRKV